MRVGAPREVKNHEYRVGLTPESARELTAHGHDVLIETGAGMGIGAEDSEYIVAGATIVPTASEIFEKCDMVVKVKEPQPAERAMLREGQILFTYLDRKSTRLNSSHVKISYAVFCLKKKRQH